MSYTLILIGIWALSIVITWLIQRAIMICDGWADCYPFLIMIIIMFIPIVNIFVSGIILLFVFDFDFKFDYKKFYKIK